LLNAIVRGNTVTYLIKPIMTTAAVTHDTLAIKSMASRKLF